MVLTVEPAPYFTEVARDAPGARPVWLRAGDGTRIRAIDWAADLPDRRGTLFLFQGRTEYIEKYSDAALELSRRGYATAALDWRGQGLSDRKGQTHMIGHVSDFSEFQSDVDAILAHGAALELPRPWHVLGHSMGGPIALRALHRRTEFRSAVFSAPMWGLPLPPGRRLLAWLASFGAVTLGLGRRETPGSGKVADPVAAPFEGNLLTTDPEMFDWMKRIITAHPELALGTPSLGWLWGALREMLVLSREAAPDVPCLTLLGSDEEIVDMDAIHVRLASWPGSHLEWIEGARHEPLMEGAVLRGRLYDRIAAHCAGEKLLS
ncbi:MAG: alpha/beta hydrolase [Pseudomonadota bacterium]